MKPAAVESLGELLALVGSAVGTVVFAVAGLLVEQAGVQNLLAGQLVLGAWELGMGAVALVAGLYLFGYQQFWRRLRMLRHADYSSD